ncbi:PTS sugar transporter subunit IIB [Melissococcus plutonius]|uniref:PTS system, cellobiose-specific IIB component n=2 Tax=Melissococcus plutonius TaxID=33970 RepID=F3Y8N8_MELPT|nr:PTS sugar transporter subunit IIB [Melissococcus plutonius]BAL62718.1 PTS system protein, cellobiose-specific IIB component [Melissococcus plutonius DAT561]AIM24541.1 PTS system protein, cellobiose-specific IIB component [Melissococcus plutonius S1]KMT24605.1 PTS system protein, cellobiose-specific IIB component [Melissococcus plutonius]KMT27318.1 PTS system protein, cellobiose-specific IIB component [Melissococcus plutonius]KMT27491.1 PTS system protein, cellobiose-specific IIB component [
MENKKVYLFCDAGMSTSIMVNKMMEVVKEHQMPLEINAFPIAQAQEMVDREKPVAILLGPQVRFLLEKTKEQFKQQNIPVAAIEPETYGMMDGEKAVKETLKLIKQHKNKK